MVHRNGRCAPMRTAEVVDAVLNGHVRSMVPSLVRTNRLRPVNRDDPAATLLVMLLLRVWLQKPRMLRRGACVSLGVRFHVRLPGCSIR